MIHEWPLIIITTYTRQLSETNNAMLMVEVK